MQTPTNDFPCFLHDDKGAQSRAAGALADSVAATLRLSLALVTRQRPVDLAGLDRIVGRLCAGVLDLPPEQGKALRGRLIALLDDLERLSAALPNP